MENTCDTVGSHKIEIEGKLGVHTFFQHDPRLQAEVQVPQGTPLPLSRSFQAAT